MKEFQENAWVERRMARQKEGHFRAYFIGLFWLPPRVQNLIFFNTFIIWASHLSISKHARKQKWWFLRISSWLIYTAIWLDMSTCCDKFWIKNAWKFSSFHFIFHSIPFSVKLLLLSLWATPTIVCSLGHVWTCLITPYKKFRLNFFPFLADYLQAKNQHDPVNPSRGICDQRILQSNWLKAFLAITHEQELS